MATYASKLRTLLTTVDGPAVTQGTYTSKTDFTDPPTKAEAVTEFGLVATELAKIKVDIAANNTAIDAIIARLKSIGAIV